MTRRQKNSLIRILAAAALFLLAILAHSGILPDPEGYVSLALFVLSYLTVGFDVILGAVNNIIHGRLFDEMFLMAVATVGAFVISEYAEAVAVMIFYQVGELFQSIAIGKSRKSIAALMSIRPDVATVLRDGEELTVPCEEVRIGETVLIRPGDRIPLDGEIISGFTTVDTSALTGESVPCDKGVGERVLSGSVNLTSLIKVNVQTEHADSTVSKILELVENSSKKKARVEKFITRFAKYYTPIVVICALLLALIPPLAFSVNLYDSIERALIFLVLSCPCALVLSVPMTFFSGIGAVSRMGVLIKGANYLEVLAKVDTVIFDKTGTLTKGRFGVVDIDCGESSPEELLHIAAALECRSSHPIAEAIVAEYEKRSGKNINKTSVSDARNFPGFGVGATLDGEACYVGNAALMAQHVSGFAPKDEEGSVVYVCRGGLYLGYILLRDEIKPEAKEALSQLKAAGVERTVMLTGDSEQVARRTAEELLLDEYHSSLLPADKVVKAESIIGENRIVAFVGDGINDAPVLSRADVGIAMGALGSDAAIEAADIVLMDDSLRKLPSAIRLCRRTLGIAYQNVWFALSVKLLILILGAFGIANMWTAIFGDVGVMVLAVLNAMRAMKTGEKASKRAKQTNL